jgi:hypothetical protein
MQQCVNGLFTMTWVGVGVGAWICMGVDGGFIGGTPREYRSWQTDNYSRNPIAGEIERDRSVSFSYSPCRCQRADRRRGKGLYRVGPLEGCRVDGDACPAVMDAARGFARDALCKVRTEDPLTR